MKILFIIIPLVFLTVSCATQYELVGSWLEEEYQREHISFQEDGTLIVDNVKGAMDFKYEVIEQNKNIIKFKLTVYQEGKEFKTALHSATFRDKDHMTLANIEDPSVQESSYARTTKSD